MVHARVLGAFLAAAALVWAGVFLWTPFDFWLVMAAGTGLLATSSILVAPAAMRRQTTFRTFHLMWGILSAAVLYLVFVAGRELTTRLLPFAEGQIASVYLKKEMLAPGWIALLVGGVIAPAEEVFWRGFLQREISARKGRMAGWLLALAAYAGVHILTGNLMLVAAAATAGAVWGWLYLRTQSLWPCIISHVLWDLTVFLLLPLI